MRIRHIGIPICLVLTFLVASRLRWPGSVGDVPQALAQQRTKWAAHKPRQYILTVNHATGSAPAWFTLSRVANGAVENVLCRQYDRSGTISECAVTDALYPLTTEQVFEAVESAYRSKYQDVEVQYDEQYGYPASVRFDPRKDKTGDEWSYAVELGETRENQP